MKNPSRRMPSPAVLFALVALSARALAADDAAARWKLYEPAFQAFAAEDRAKPPRRGGILFVGSSIFRQWTNVAEHMAPMPALNRAFGGSRTGDLVARFDQVVLPYAPKVIVYYCGSNDLKQPQADPPGVIFARFREFSQRVQRALPGTKFLYVASTRAPDRVPRWEQVDHYNALVRAYCESTPHHMFIDINPALVDANGHPRLDLYKPDKLHFPLESYTAFAAVIRPALERVWREVGG